MTFSAGKEDSIDTAALLGEAAEVDPHRHGHPSLTGRTKPLRIIPRLSGGLQGK